MDAHHFHTRIKEEDTARQDNIVELGKVREESLRHIHIVVSSAQNIYDTKNNQKSCRDDRAYHSTPFADLTHPAELNPAEFEVADIYNTSVCPLAKVMRHELKKRGIKKLKVVYSKEKAITPNKTTAAEGENEVGSKKAVPGSTAFVPSVAGLIIASEVIKDLM